MPTKREIEAAVKAIYSERLRRTTNRQAEIEIEEYAYARAALEAAERERDKIKAEQKYALEAHLSRDDLNCP